MLSSQKTREYFVNFKAKWGFCGIYEYMKKISLSIFSERVVDNLIFSQFLMITNSNRKSATATMHHALISFMKLT